MKAEQAGGCAGASPWAAGDGSKENSIRLSREKKKDLSQRRSELLGYFITAFPQWFSLLQLLSASWSLRY